MPNRNGPGARADAHGAGIRYVGQQSFTRAGRTLYLPSRIKRHRPTKADIERRRNNLLVIVKAMRPMTVRQVFYQATVRGIVEKSEAGYAKVQTDLVQMRRAGLRVARRQHALAAQAAVLR